MNKKQIGAFEQFRAGFPGVQKWTYMDVAARGLLSTGVRGAVDEYLDHRVDQGANKEWMFSMCELARSRFAALIGATTEEVSLTKNVTEGINAFAHALTWKRGDNVVLCSEIEHPANIFPWYGLARQHGIEVRNLPSDAGRFPLEKVIAAMDDRTRIVTVADVSFSPGFRAPIKQLGAICRSKGALLLVDAAQTVGVMHTDVNELNIDALSVATQKGLLGLYGMGFLYVKRAVAQQLQPVYISRMGIQLEEAHEAAVGDPTKFHFAEGARRFDLGNFNFIGCVAVAQSMADLDALGSREVESHVVRLAKRLAAGLAEAGLPVFGGVDCEDRAHIVALGRGLSNEHDSTEDTQLTRLHEAFVEDRVRHTIRRGLVRLSLHAYNNEDDVDRAVSTAKKFMSRAANFERG